MRQPAALSHSDYIGYLLKSAYVCHFVSCDDCGLTAVPSAYFNSLRSVVG